MWRASNVSDSWVPSDICSILNPHVHDNNPADLFSAIKILFKWILSHTCHFKCLIYLLLIILTGNTNVLLFFFPLFCHFLHNHHHPVPMPTDSVRLFRCTGMEATEMCHHWKCRRKEEFCKWRDAQRKKQVGRRAVYKGARWSSESRLSLDSLAFTPISKAEGLGRAEQDLCDRRRTIRKPACGSAEEAPYDFKVVCIRPDSSLSAPRPHVCATVHHGDQHGHPACPFAASGDGGVPPVSGYGLCLQGRATRAPPPLRAVRHHRRGGGRLLQAGGGPGPEVVLADGGEPEEEHQMRPFIIWARGRGHQTWPQPVWGTVHAVVEADRWSRQRKLSVRGSGGRNDPWLWLTDWMNRKALLSIIRSFFFFLICFSVISNIQVTVSP